MQKSSIGHYYENFKYARVFLVEGEELVTIKAYKAWKGKHYGAASWICLSYKSQRPIIYQFIPGLRIQNITYKKLSSEINTLIGLSSKKDIAKRNRVKRKFAKLCGKFFTRQDINSIDSINIECLTAWMPLLSHYQDKRVLEFIPILSQAQVRQGFKQDSLKRAIKVWFGRSPKCNGLQKLEPRLAKTPIFGSN